MADDLTSYGELLEILAALPLLVREKRRRCQLSLRAAGQQCGLNDSTIHRVEQGNGDPSLSNAAALLAWVGRPDLATALTERKTG